MLQNSMLFNWINAIRNDPVDGIITMLMQIVAILGALILHEVAHGYVALWCGDPTAKMLGSQHCFAVSRGDLARRANFRT